MEYVPIPNEILVAAIKVSKATKKPVEIGNGAIRVLSERKPTFKRNGKRLILSNGPSFHQDYLFSAYATIDEVASTVIWTIS